MNKTQTWNEQNHHSKLIIQRYMARSLEIRGQSRNLILPWGGMVWSLNIEFFSTGILQLLQNF